MIFKTRPNNFHGKAEVVSCFCEYGGRILLLRRQSYKQYGNTWGPPAGKISKNESSRQAILRELKEESGLEIIPEKLNYFDKVFVRYPEYDFVFHIFHTLFERLPEIKIREQEHKAYQWFLPEEALRINLIRDEDGIIKLFYGI